MSLIQAAILLFMVIDPLGNIPVYVSVLRGLPIPRQRAIILREHLIALGIMLAVLFAGRQVMGYIGLSQPALGIAGGIVLFLIGLRMIFPSAHGVFGDEDAGGGEPLVVPIAVPLVAGPSAMATLMLLSAREPERVGTWTIALLIAWTLATLIMLGSPWFARMLGRRLLGACERLLGMLLVAVSVQQFLDGLSSILHRG